jgi:hypothetical protein
MADNHIEDPRAEEAMTELATLVRSETVANKDKISAARTILEFSKEKPAQKKDVTYHKAEDLLDEVAQEVEDVEYEQLPAPTQEELTDGTNGETEEGT